MAAKDKNSKDKPKVDVQKVISDREKVVRHNEIVKK
jgi:hypothetical protein